jgi:hypothetical protein
MAIEDVVKNLRYRAEGRRKSGKLLQIDDKMFDLIADDIETAIKREREAVGNAAKIRAALQAALPIMRDCPFTHYNTTEVDKVVEEMEAALSSPPRNCDLFGGDPKKLHELWWEWSGDLKNCNADGTVKLTYGEWLLELADAKGGEK